MHAPFLLWNTNAVKFLIPMLWPLHVALFLLVLFMASSPIQSIPTSEDRVLLHQQQDAEAEGNIRRPVLLIEGSRFPVFDFLRHGDDASTRGPGSIFSIAGRPIYLAEEEDNVVQNVEQDVELEDEEHTVRTAGSVWDCVSMIIIK